MIISHEKKFKLLVIGDKGVGKTALVQKYCCVTFKPDMKITIGYKPYTKDLNLEGYGSVRLKIWENLDEKEFQYLIPKFVRGADGAMFCFSLADKKTLKSFDDWVEIFQKENLSIPVMLVGTKSDLKDSRSVTKEEAFEFGEIHGCCAYVGISTKENSNVELAFETITKFMLG